VVKNLAFNIEVGSTIDLSTCPLPGLEVKLLYDFDKLEDVKRPIKEREVSCVKNQPLDYKLKLTDGGKKAIIELKIKVLTSQHEAMLFQCYFSATDPSTGEIIDVFSRPIKVVSKISLISGRKELMNSMGTLTLTKKRPAATSPNLLLSSSSISPKMESSFGENGSHVNTTHTTHNSGNISDTLSRIENSQKETQDMVRLILQKLTPQSGSTMNLPSSNEQLKFEYNTSKSNTPHKKDEFDALFSQLVPIYQSWTPEQKRSRLQYYLENSSKQNLNIEVLCEFLDNVNVNLILPPRKKKRTSST